MKKIKSAIKAGLLKKLIEIVAIIATTFGLTRLSEIVEYIELIITF